MFEPMQPDRRLDDDHWHIPDSTYGCSVDAMMDTYDLLDLIPKGRNERDVPDKMEWVRPHDCYVITMAAFCAVDG